MANRNNRRKARVGSSSQAKNVDASTVNVTLRLPEQLADSGRSYSASVGTSLNALLCIALADYLRDRDVLK